MSQNFRIDWNVPRIVRNVEQAFQETAELLGVKFTQTITSNIWNWTDGSTRDIVDTGQLRDSQTLDWQGRHTAIFSWNTSYAAAVHHGAVLRNGGSMPARPWTTFGMNEFDVLGTFIRIYRSLS